MTRPARVVPLAHSRSATHELLEVGLSARSCASSSPVWPCRSIASRTPRFATRRCPDNNVMILPTSRAMSSADGVSIQRAPCDLGPHSSLRHGVSYSLSADRGRVQGAIWLLRSGRRVLGSPQTCSLATVLPSPATPVDVRRCSVPVIDDRSTQATSDLVTRYGRLDRMVSPTHALTPTPWPAR